jgi:hypothetical protein
MRSPENFRAFFRTPAWLSDLRSQDEFPLRLLLKNSLYYPASACDGRPVRFLGGFIHSFVYTDYSLTKSAVMEQSEGVHHGFSGYKLAMSREVSPFELYPDEREPLQIRNEDGNPLVFKSEMPDPFALWSIFDRQPGLDDFHGPARFSVLHICGDGVATYDALYNAQQIRPDILAIIRPGSGYGLNWTEFRDSEQIFGRVVFSNKAGRPHYLFQALEGDSNAEGYWPGYEIALDTWQSGSGNLALYECKNPNPINKSLVNISSTSGSDYEAFADIPRRSYATFKRNRDEATQTVARC